ncbi:unnamed protein product, partial [Didymodactylos carnosus]
HLDSLPCADYYERSYMHRDVVTHCLVTKTDFLITGSADGHIKFWKILTVEYVKMQATLSSYQQQQQQLSASSKEQQINGAKGISGDVQTSGGPLEFVNII